MSSSSSSSSMPVYQQQQSPPFTVTQPSYHGATQHDSIGPLIGVLIVIIVLGIIAVMIGRLCSGRRIMGHGQYDIESWAEKKCSTCIDGRINHSIPMRVNETTTTSLPATPNNTQQETRQEEQSSQNSPPNT